MFFNIVIHLYQFTTSCSVFFFCFFSPFKHQEYLVLNVMYINYKIEYFNFTVCFQSSHTVYIMFYSLYYTNNLNKPIYKYIKVKVVQYYTSIEEVLFYILLLIIIQPPGTGIIILISSKIKKDYYLHAWHLNLAHASKYKV